MKLRIEFVDFINHQQDSLENIAKVFALPTQKQEVDHSVITLKNYREEYGRQQIGYYLKCDCKVLYDAILKYDELV